MDFFDKHKALILTTLFCSVVVLALYNFNLSKKQKNFSEMMISLEEEEMEIQEEEQKEEETPEPPSENQQLTHQASDENQQEREENLNREIDEIFERNSASREESSEEENTSEAGEFNTGNTSSKNRKASQGNDATKETSTQAGRLRNSSISYSLQGRNAIHIPNPVYTCDRPGKIVVNIKVDAEGRVQQTNINKSSSTTSNHCLTEKALEYAAGARFSQLPGRDNQPGTITFLFQP